MPFLKGGVTAKRYKCAVPILPDDEAVAAIKAWSFEKKFAPTGTPDKTCGFSGGLDHLDGNFDVEKLVRGEFLAFGFRVTQTKIPPQELKARVRVELDALTKGGKKATALLKREAREAAQSLLEQQAEDGRFTKHTPVPVVIDTTAGQVWYGHSSHAHRHAFEELFQQAFGAELVPLSPATLAELPDYPGDAPAWTPDGRSKDAWGTRWAERVVRDAMAGIDEFDAGGESVALMVATSLAMGSPMADRGAGVFKREVPVRMPEAIRAVEDGKLPTGLGLEAAWAGLDGTVKFALVPHEWVVTGAKVPEPESQDRAVREAERLLQCRAFFAKLDALFVTYAAGVFSATSNEIG